MKHLNEYIKEAVTLSTFQSGTNGEGGNSKLLDDNNKTPQNNKNIDLEESSDNPLGDNVKDIQQAASMLNRNNLMLSLGKAVYFNKAPQMLEKLKQSNDYEKLYTSVAHTVSEHNDNDSTLVFLSTKELSNAFMKAFGIVSGSLFNLFKNTIKGFSNKAVANAKNESFENFDEDEILEANALSNAFSKLSNKTVMRLRVEYRDGDWGVIQFSGAEALANTLGPLKLATTAIGYNCAMMRESVSTMMFWPRIIKDIIQVAASEGAKAPIVLAQLKMAFV